MSWDQSSAIFLVVIGFVPRRIRWTTAAGTVRWSAEAVFWRLAVSRSGKRVERWDFSMPLIGHLASMIWEVVAVICKHRR